MDARYFNLLDSAGQPIGGIASERYEPSSVEVTRCPYSGSRHGRPMDLTALRAVTAHWPRTLQAARALSGPHATVHRAWRTCMALLHAPLFLQELGPTVVPVEMVGGVKVSLGYAQVLTDLLLTTPGLADAPLVEQIDGHTLFQTLDHDGRLLGQQHVCSGTPAMFAAFWTALAGGPDPLPAPWSDIPAFDTRMDWQLGHYGALAARVLSGELRGSITPWLYARTGGDARLALRLFPTGEVPPRLRQQLSSGGGRTPLG